MNEGNSGVLISDISCFGGKLGGKLSRFGANLDFTHNLPPYKRVT